MRRGHLHRVHGRKKGAALKACLEGTTSPSNFCTKSFQPETGQVLWLVDSIRGQHARSASKGGSLGENQATSARTYFLKPAWDGESPSLTRISFTTKIQGAAALPRPPISYRPRLGRGLNRNIRFLSQPAKGSNEHGRLGKDGLPNRIIAGGPGYEHSAGAKLRKKPGLLSTRETS